MLWSRGTSGGDPQVTFDGFPARGIDVYTTGPLLGDMRSDAIGIARIANVPCFAKRLFEPYACAV